METMTLDALVELEKLGLEFHEVNKEPFREKVQPVYIKYADRVGGIEVIEEVIRY